MPCHMRQFTYNLFLKENSFTFQFSHYFGGNGDLHVQLEEFLLCCRSVPFAYSETGCLLVASKLPKKFLNLIAFWNPVWISCKRQTVWGRRGFMCQEIIKLTGGGKTASVHERTHYAFCRKDWAHKREDYQWIKSLTRSPCSRNAILKFTRISTKKTTSLAKSTVPNTRRLTI